MQEKHQIILLEIEWSGSNKFNNILAASKALPLICQGHTGSHNIEAVVTWKVYLMPWQVCIWYPWKLPPTSACRLGGIFQGTRWQTYGPRGPNIMTTFIPVCSRSMQWESIGRQPRLLNSSEPGESTIKEPFFFYEEGPLRRLTRAIKLHNQNRNL